ncbi:transcription factor RfeG [Colletotrichum orchidophilum]|uniref:Transcription factor RfeG n=1 Tax=Colletotrichum orchidophilum TaxID=1209926 RepID=A0A1G4BPF5_9PEZI|nr:transcription factor RfeG [Colletotrichum orchidophilum]OHF03339.1 transcription factor RfeG [Colletotrichum orchidophilum]
MSRSSRGPPPSASAVPQSGRSNEYFVPRDGIDREVITADICRYLGNDALVRPGHYENPQTGQVSQGYYITAYRNLTTAMIDDLKADSARWENERRQQAARNSSGAGYRQSETHSARQHYGPTDSTGYPDVGRDSYESAPRYPGSQAPGYSGNSSQGYSGSTPSYQPQPSSSYSSGGYPYSGQPDTRADPRYTGSSQMGQGGYGESPYIATAANLAARSNYPADAYGAGQPSRTPTSMAPPQGGQAYPPGSQVPAGYPSGYYPPSTSASYGSTPVASDPLYGRAGGVAHPSLSAQGGSQYDKPPAPRGSAPPSSSKAQTTSSGPSHSRRSERDSDRHHQSDRHRPPRR